MIDEIAQKVRLLRANAVKRDAAMADIYAVRNGEIDRVFPGMFSEDFPKPVIANACDVFARTVAESLAPLPAFNCSSSNMVSDASRARADKRTKGAQFYVHHSRLQTQMYKGADYYGSYGLMPIHVQPDYENRCPRMEIIDPRGCYPQIDRWGRCVSFTQIVKKKIYELCADFPEHTNAICGPLFSPTSDALLEVAVYCDDKVQLMFIPERKNTVLAIAENKLGVCPVTVAVRPGITDTPRGQYDDVLWIQVARNRFAMLAMQAAEQAVEAPLAVPYDVQEMAVGPLATLRTNSPEKIRRVGAEIPQAAFLEGQVLDQELQTAARFPGVRTGNLDASIITGQGVRALEGGYDQALKAAQDMFAQVFEEAIGLCFRMDEMYWPNVSRSIRGESDGVPYEIMWTPGKDIKGDHSVNVTYGFASGMDPNRGLVFLLQARGDRLVSRDLVRRQLPVNINVSQEEQRVEIEELRDALIQSVAGLAQAVPMMAQSGMDPTQVLTQLSTVIKGRQKGKPLEDVIAEAFAPAPEPAPPADMTGSGGMAPGLESAGGVPPEGMPAGMAGPGGGGGAPPDLMSLLAGLNSGGAPNMTASVKRQLPI